MRVLIAEDDRALGTLLMRTFQELGYTVAWVQDGEAAVAAWHQAQYGLLVLDLNLPKLDGTEVLRTIRAESDAAVLVLTARNSLDERLRCLELGADDFLAKPFSLRELEMRCQGLVRRFRTTNGSVLRCGDLLLDRMRRVVERNGNRVDLTVKEFALLEYLLEHRGECVSRADLLRHVWAMHPDANTNIVDVYINYLRTKMDKRAGNKLIHTVRGNGYSLREPSPEAA
ncbi:MAG: response regulator transcription factor [Acidobacteriaceae bacterium]